MRRALSLFLLAVCPVAALAQGAQPDPLAAELQSHSQEMLDAVATGKADVWAKYLADDAMLTGDDGVTRSKEEMLKEISPLPPGFVGEIRIQNPQLRRAGDAVVLSYEMLEHLTVSGQKVADQRYHATETWTKRAGAWQIIASEAQRLHTDPPEAKAAPPRLDDYAGTYRLGPMTYAVTVEDGRLYGQRGTGKKQPLLPETPDVFFRKGIPGYKFFERDAGGAVVRLIDRKNGADLVWERAAAKR